MLPHVLFLPNNFTEAWTVGDAGWDVVILNYESHHDLQLLLRSYWYLLLLLPVAIAPK